MKFRLVYDAEFQNGSSLTIYGKLAGQKPIFDDLDQYGSQHKS